MTKKKPEQNPIEEAIGDRAKPKGNLADLPENAVLTPVHSNPSKIPDEPTPSEMLTLEELNHEAVERLQDQYPEEEHGTYEVTLPTKVVPKSPIPVSKPESQPVTKTCSPESPPQETESASKRALENMIKSGHFDSDGYFPESDETDKSLSPEAKKEIDELIVEAEAPPQGIKIEGSEKGLTIKDCSFNPPAEDKELTNLKKYIMEDGYNESAVAFHIVTLCTQPMTTPCTTTWDFRDRAMVPEMVFTLLIKGGYLEGIWASLKIVMGSNVGNSAWAAGIATTIAFFDTVRMLPILKEMKALDNGN